MRPLGLVLVLLVCDSCWGVGFLSAENPVALVEELEDPDFEATTGLNLRSVKSALKGKELQRLQELNAQANAAKASETQQKHKGDSPLQLDGDFPVDVMKYKSRDLKFRQASTPEDEQAKKESARLEKNSQKTRGMAMVATMKKDIDESIKKTMRSYTKSAAAAGRTWDSVFPSADELKPPSSGLNQGQLQAEARTAEKEQLLNREHAVANAEQNLAYVEHQAQHQVMMAQREAQATESRQLEKVEGKEDQAEQAEAKARADEAAALELKKKNKEETGKLKAEVHSLRQKLARAASQQQVEALKLKVETNKAVDAARKAVQRQSRLDKHDEESELHAMKESAHDLSSKLKSAKSQVGLEAKENAHLRKQLAGEAKFTSTEVTHAAAKAHLVAEKLWQGKVKYLSSELVNVKQNAKDKVESVEQAMSAWAKVAHKLKAKLAQQHSAMGIMQQAQAKVAASQKAMLGMSRKLKMNQMALETMKAAQHLKNQELALLTARNAAAQHQIQDLMGKQSAMAKTQLELQARQQSASDQLKNTQQQLEEAKRKLQALQKPLSHDKGGHVRFATAKDFKDVVSGKKGGGHEHLLPHKLNLDLNVAENAMEKAVGLKSTSPNQQNK